MLCYYQHKNDFLKFRFKVKLYMAKHELMLDAFFITGHFSQIQVESKLTHIRVAELVSKSKSSLITSLLTKWFKSISVVF